MKTLRITLFFILGIIITFHSFAQELKKEKKAILNIEIIDPNGNKHVIDTAFTIAPDQNYSEIIQQIKEQAGFSKGEIAAMKSEFEANAKQMKMDMQVLMNGMDKEKIHDHMMMVREQMNKGKEDLKQALEDLKLELEGMEMNKEAMQKLEKAMQELHKVEWTEHSKHLDYQMNKMHKYLDKDVNVFVIDGDNIEKDIWIDDNGEKRIIIKMEMDDDSLLSKEKVHKMIFIVDDNGDDEDVWVDRNGKNIQIKKFRKGGNTIFFGDEADLEKIEELDGDHRVILKKLRGEAAKGNAIFISDDADMVKEFKDEDGNIKVMRYQMKSGDGVEKGDHKKGFMKMTLSISPANADEIGLATSKGIFSSKAGNLVLNEFTFDIDNEISTVGATFEEKGKLTMQLFDKEMNKLWEKKAGKVQGEWSVEIPGGILKDKGVYFLHFIQGKKAKLLKMVNN